MRIRLKHNIPVDTKHGLWVGREFDVLEDESGEPRCSGKPQSRRVGWVWIMGEAGEEVKVLGHEYEIIYGDSEDQA